MRPGNWTKPLADWRLCQALIVLAGCRARKALRLSLHRQALDRSACLIKTEPWNRELSHNGHKNATSCGLIGLTHRQRSGHWQENILDFAKFAGIYPLIADHEEGAYYGHNRAGWFLLGGAAFIQRV